MSRRAFTGHTRSPKQSGHFPNVWYHYIPTLCNHCENAPCVRGCPTQAMHKQENGITMHDPKKCIGCRYCQFNCPYGVIYFNWNANPIAFGDRKRLDQRGNVLPSRRMAREAGGKVIPNYNPERDRNPCPVCTQGRGGKMHVLRSSRQEEGYCPPAWRLARPMHAYSETSKILKATSISCWVNSGRIG